MSKRKPKIDTFIQNERGFTLIRCERCGEFYNKHGKRHLCGEENSIKLSGKIIQEDGTCTTK